jgi:uncharacterized membrane protein
VTSEPIHRTTGTTHAAAAASILLVASVLRILALDKPFYIDEIVTITVARHPFAEMAGVMRQIDASPALYPVLLHAWMTLSNSDAWVRLLSAVFGVGSVVAIYAVARRAYGPAAALGAALVAGMAPAHIHYSQYVRSYSLFALLVAVHVLLVLRWFDRPSGPRLSAACAFAALTAALLYTHYLSLLLLPVEGVFLLWHHRRINQAVLRWVGAVALAGMLFIPGIPLLFHNLEFDRIRNEARPLPPPLYRMVPDLFGELSVGQRLLGFEDPVVRRATLAVAALVFPGLLVVGAVDGWRRNRPATVLLLLSTLLPIAIYVGSGRRLVAVRFFVPFLAGWLVVQGNGLAALRPRWRTILALVVVTTCAIPLAHFYRRFSWSYDHRSAARAIAERFRAGDVLLFVHPYEAFYYRWYLGATTPMEGLVFTALKDQATYVIKPQTVTLESAIPRIQAVEQHYDRFWLIGQSPRSFASDPQEERRLLDWMDERFGGPLQTLTDVTADDPVIRLYARPRRVGDGAPSLAPQMVLHSAAAR